MQDYLYYPMLQFHGAFRWIVLITLLAALGMSYRGWWTGKPWTRTDAILSSLFVGAIDIQLTTGLLLYFGLSPLMQGSFHETSSNSEVRFFAFHMVAMLGAVIVAHAGKIAAARTPLAHLKHRRTTLFFTASLILILSAIPWWRSFFRY